MNQDDCARGVNRGYFPGKVPDTTRSCRDSMQRLWQCQDLLDFLFNQRGRRPSTTLSSVADTLTKRTALNGRSGIVDARILEVGLREYSLLQASIDKAVFNQSNECPSCMGGDECDKKDRRMHIDGNSKLYRFNVNKSGPHGEANFFKEGIISVNSTFTCTLAAEAASSNKKTQDACGDWRATRIVGKCQPTLSDHGLECK